MALSSDGAECYQLIESKYKCKHFKTGRRRDFKEYNQNVLRYHVKQEIILLEHEHESQKEGRFVKYSKKRCNCKIKKISDDEKNNPCLKTKANINTNNSCHFREISFSSQTCTSILASMWNCTYLSPLTGIPAEKSFFIDSQAERSPFLGSPIAETILPLKLETVPSSFSTLCTTQFPLNRVSSFNWTPTEIKSTFCDIPSDYLKYNKYKLNILTHGKRQSPLKCNRQTHPKLSYNYMLMILVMVIKELIRHSSESLNQIRRKTQFLLPVFMLLQLLMAAPLTHCTSPPNQTLAAAISSSSAFRSSVALEIEESQLSSTATSAPPNGFSNQDKMHQNEQHPPSQMSSTRKAISHRPTGGSSITSYIGHEAKIRRDPSISFTSSGCHSCQMREQVKADNLESIKKHILLRLEMQALPNITAPPVPHTIIENFYKNHSNNEHKRTSLSHPESSAAEKSSSLYTALSLPSSFVNSNDGTKKNDNNMQGDDPNIFSNDYDQAADDQDDKDEDLPRNNFEDEFFSVINSVYVFPTMPRMRHNRKAEILNFKFKGNEHSTISQALLHVYIRGRDWIREYEPDLFDTKNSINDDHREIVITVHRVIRRNNSAIATHTVNVTESQHKIPNGLGQWISIDVTQLVQGWVRNTTTNQGIVIKAAESWMKPFIITGDLPNNKAFTVYIEMLTKDNRKRRTKRNTSMNCSESDNEERCCRYPLVVNFVEFEWTWVVAPTSFNAYFCNGECKLGFLEKYPHTHLMQLSTAPQPCCSPTKMSPLRLLYFNAENTLVMSTIPNMAVEKCSCS